MSDSPLFSIVMPAYNASRFMAEAIECVLSQTFTNWELIIVDDCSTDSTPDIAEGMSVRDSRIAFHRRTKNSGVAYTPRLEAAHKANGDFIIPIDADDFVDSTLLETLAAKIFETKADLVIPEMWRFSVGKPHKILPLDTLDSSKIWAGRDLVCHTLRLWEIPMAGFAVRREIYLKGDDKITACDRKSIFADELLSRWILAFSGKAAFCNARYYYRHNPESVTHNTPRQIEGHLITCDGLAALTKTLFGDHSPQHLRALEDKFLKIVDSLRLLNKTHLSKAENGMLEDMISSHLSTLNIRDLRGHISPRYLTLMRLPVPIARLALHVLDPLLLKK